MKVAILEGGMRESLSSRRGCLLGYENEKELGGPAEMAPIEKGSQYCHCPFFYLNLDLKSCIRLRNCQCHFGSFFK